MSEGHISTVRYSTVQYSTVRYSTVQYSAVQYSTVRYSAVQYSTVQYGTVRTTFGGTAGKELGRKISKKKSPVEYGVPSGPEMHARSMLKHDGS